MPLPRLSLGESRDVVFRERERERKEREREGEKEREGATCYYGHGSNQFRPEKAASTQEHACLVSRWTDTRVHVPR